MELQFILHQCALDVSVISGKPEVHPKMFLVVKKLFKNVTLQILNPIPVSQLIKIFPVWCTNVKFSLLFVLFNAVKTDSKLTLHHMGKFLSFIKIKFGLV